MVINIVGSGTATYGEISDGGDWLLNNGSGNCSADFSIPVQTSTVTLSYNGDGNVPEFDVDLMKINLSEAHSEDITLDII